MKLAVLFSGGKDSVMALDWAFENHTPALLITMHSENKESYMFHTDCIDLVQSQADATGMPLLQYPTAGIKEEELLDLKEAIKIAADRFQIEGVVAGALASSYQRNRVENICIELKLKCFSPYWQVDPEGYMRLLVAKGYKAKIVHVAAEGLTKKWVGRVIDEQAINELRKLNEKYGIHLAGEGGEYETFVFDGPIFKNEVAVKP